MQLTYLGNKGCGFLAAQEVNDFNTFVLYICVPELYTLGWQIRCGYMPIHPGRSACIAICKGIRILLKLWPALATSCLTSVKKVAKHGSKCMAAGTGLFDAVGAGHSHGRETDNQMIMTGSPLKLARLTTVQTCSAFVSWSAPQQLKLCSQTIHWKLLQPV